LGALHCILTLQAQLVNYLVEAVCLRRKGSRLAEGSFGASEEVELLAVVVGFALVAMQAAGMIYAYRHERAKDASTGIEREGEQGATEARKGEIQFENPVVTDG
jgi:hypothetical protein